MNPTAMAVANVRALFPRLVGLMILLAVTVGLCATALTISESAGRTAKNRVQEGAPNRSITVDRLSDRPDTMPLNEATLHRFAALPHVNAVQPRAQVSFGYKDGSVPGVLLYATTIRASQLPPVTRSTRADLFPLRPGEVVLPTTAQGSSLAGLLGRTITVDTTRAVANGQGTGAQAAVRVVGLFDAGWQLDGPDAAYADDHTVIGWSAERAGVTPDQFVASVGYDRVTVVVDNSRNVPDLLRRIQSEGYPASTLQQEMTALPGVLSLIDITGHLLLWLLGLVALVGALVVTGALSRQRAREVGILKAVGFRNRSILTVFVTEMAIVAATASVLGTILGLAAAAGAAAVLRGHAELAPFVSATLPLPDPQVILGLVALTVAVTVLGAWLPARRAARLAPSDAIKEW